MRAISNDLNFVWRDKQGNMFGADVKFDEDEIFKAFKEVFKEDKNQEGELRFTLNEVGDDFNVALRNKTQEYELNTVDIGVYKRSKGKYDK